MFTVKRLSRASRGLDRDYLYLSLQTYRNSLIGLLEVTQIICLVIAHVICVQ